MFWFAFRSYLQHTFSTNSRTLSNSGFFRSAIFARNQSTLRWRPATEIFYEESLKQKKFATRAKNALRATFENDKSLKHLFTNILGFEICNIRVAMNKRTFFVQWDSFPERKQETFAALIQNMTRIRKGVGKYLGARNTPRLEFRHDSFNAGQAELESAFEELEQKEDEEILQTALGRKRFQNHHLNTSKDVN